MRRATIFLSVASLALLGTVAFLAVSTRAQEPRPATEGERQSGAPGHIRLEGGTSGVTSLVWSGERPQWEGEAPGHIRLEGGTSGVTSLVWSGERPQWEAHFFGKRVAYTLHGEVAAVETCQRCGRELGKDPGNYSGRIQLIERSGRTFFDGCIDCLEDAIQAGAWASPHLSPHPDWSQATWQVAWVDSSGEMHLVRGEH